MHVTVVGAGVAGLTCAVELAERGARVEVLERSETLGVDACSWMAGGMLAPWCERESAEPIVARLGEESIAWWSARFAGLMQQGSLVVAHARDAADLASFARKTERYAWLGAAQIAQLEPDLTEGFQQGLFFKTEAHLNPREAMLALARRLADLGAVIRLGSDGCEVLARAQSAGDDRAAVVDCRGLDARDVLADLRGVKGEMVLLRQREITLGRPIRLLHPRVPLYVVPRADGLFMVGATSIESDEPRKVTVRSVLELLSAAYALHPAFGEAEVVEIATGVRPAFADNLPGVRRHGGVLRVNGLYRHGFLVAPALARIVADALLEGRNDPEVMDEDHPQRQIA